MPNLFKWWKVFNGALTVVGVGMCAFWLWATWESFQGRFLQIPQLEELSWIAPLAGFFLFFWVTIDTWQDATANEPPRFLRPENQWLLPYVLFVVGGLCYVVGYFQSGRENFVIVSVLGIIEMAFGLWLMDKVPPRNQRPY